MLGEAPIETKSGIVTAPHIVTAGDYLLVMVGTGGSVSQARQQAYRSLRKIVVPNSPMYRTDIGERLRKELPILQAQGYATGLAY
jgi:phosphoribosylamine-glycine ligase